MILFKKASKFFRIIQNLLYRRIPIQNGLRCACQVNLKYRYSFNHKNTTNTKQQRIEVMNNSKVSVLCISNIILIYIKILLTKCKKAVI